MYKYIIRSIVLIFPEVLFQNGQSWYWFNTSKLLEMKITSKDTVSVKGSKFLEEEMETNTVTNEVDHMFLNVFKLEGKENKFILLSC